MILKYIILALIAFGGGAVISGAVFALITSTGVVTRMADTSRTAKHVRAYESAIVFGGAWWNLFWIFSISLPFAPNIVQGFQLIMGLTQESLLVASQFHWQKHLTEQQFFQEE